MVGHGRCTCGSEKWREAEDTGEVVLRNRVHQGRKGQKAKLCGRCSYHLNHLLWLAQVLVQCMSVSQSLMA